MDRQVSTSRNDLECMLLDETTEPRALPLSLLEDITSRFSEHQEIGRGGFAVVYKGTLANGLTVAVKRLSHCYMHEKEFHREVECLLKVQHTNVVRFLGYCSDTQGSMADFNGQYVMADVQQRLLCFEYLPNGSLHEYIQDATTGLEWSKRYKIIKGVCEGLSYLHHKNIIHLDLKPTNILMDANMVPKISDFGLSRIFEEDKSRFLATNVGGTMGYLAPEFTSHVITHKFDLYSLGVILIEILTGKRGYQAVETVLESWSNRLDKSQGETSFEQIRVCAEIGIECIDPNPDKRPVSIHHIVSRLNETGSAQVNTSPSELLDVQPLVLRFAFEPNKSIPCSLQLTNNTDEHVSFRLKNKSGNQQCFARLPLYGVVPPRSVYIAVVTTDKQEKLPEQKYFDLILESSILGDLHSWSSERKHDRYFEEAKEMGHVVHEVTLKAVCTQQRGIIMSEVSHVEIPYKEVLCMDTHPTKQWIITAQYNGRIRIWGYETQRLVDSFKVSRTIVCSIKFISRKKWFVAGTGDGSIHVYNYEKGQKITSFRANTDEEYVASLSVHPSLPYVLSLSANCSQAKLWDWNRGWECIQTFMTEYFPELQFVFNPMDSITLASASKHHIVKIWSLHSPEPEYTLSGHSKRVNCLEFFTRDDHQYLITGSDDCTAKIWNLRTKTCDHTLEAFTSQIICVFSSPSHPMLITGSSDGTVHLMSSANFRVEKVVQIGYTGNVCLLDCLMGPKRVVIGHGNKEAISIMDIDNVSSHIGSTNSLAGQLRSDTRLEDKTFQVIQGSSTLLDVRPLVLHFSCKTNKHAPCSIQLTNKTNERVAYKLMGSIGIVPAKSNYTLIVSARMVDPPPKDHDVILQSSICGDKYVPFYYESECDEFFDEVKEMGNTVHELTLKAIFSLHGETTPEAIPPITKIIPSVECHDAGRLCSLDAHPIEPLILTGHNKRGHRSEIRLWNYDTPAKAMLYTVCGNPAYSVKFIAQKQWFVAGTSDGSIRVYKYGTEIQQLTSFKAHGDYIIKLTVHPTQSYVISLSKGLLKLWDWNKGWPDLIKNPRGWKCIRTFVDENYCCDSPVAFNPKDMNCFAVASNDHTIQVWNIDSPRCKYTLIGHADKVNCLEFFRRDGQQYFCTGSDDCTAKIWDLKRKTCVHTLRAFVCPVFSIISLPDLPYIITCSRDGTIHIWNYKTSRLERTVSFGRGGDFPRICLMGTRRVVIGQWGRISFIDINNEEAAQ